MKKPQIDCRTCKNYREGAWNDFCRYKGHKIVALDRFSCEGYEQKQRDHLTPRQVVRQIQKP